MQEFPVHGWLELIFGSLVPLVVYPLIVGAALIGGVRTMIRSLRQRATPWLRDQIPPGEGTD